MNLVGVLELNLPLYGILKIRKIIITLNYKLGIYAEKNKTNVRKL